MFTAVVEGANDPDIEGVDALRRAALSATAADVLDADGYLLGTPANIGYMSGALKHFFDTIYYPCLDSTVGRPYGGYLHGNNDTTGAATCSHPRALVIEATAFTAPSVPSLPCT